MLKAASTALILMFVILGGGLLLMTGEYPVLVALVIGGSALFVIRVNAIVDRSRIRRGKEPDLTFQLADLQALTQRDVFELAATTAAGAGMVIAGVVAYGGGA